MACILVRAGVAACLVAFLQRWRGAVGGTRQGLMLWRSALQADSPAMLAGRSRGETHCASCRSLRSNSRRESDHEARAVHAPTALLRFSAPQKSPQPGTAHRAATRVVFVEEYLGGAGKTVVGCASAATYAAPRNGRLAAARAQRALRDLTRRDCLSATTAGSEASFPAGRETEYRREPLPQRGAAASERRRIPGRGFARANGGREHFHHSGLLRSRAAHRYRD